MEIGGSQDSNLWKIILYKNGKVDSFWSSMLPKIHIASLFYRIQCWTTFILNFLWYDAYFWQRRTLNWIYFQVFVHYYCVFKSQWRHNVFIMWVAFLLMVKWAHLRTPWACLCLKCIPSLTEVKIFVLLAQQCTHNNKIVSKIISTEFCLVVLMYDGPWQLSRYRPPII